MLVMDVKQIRKQNLITLVDQIGGQAALARRVETAPAYLSQILSKKSKKSVGDDLARRLEVVFGLGHGWMDQLHTADQEGTKDYPQVQCNTLSEPASLETHFTSATWPLVKLLRDMDLQGTLPPDLIEGMTLMLKSWHSAWVAKEPNRKFSGLLEKTEGERAANEAALAASKPWLSITGTPPADNGAPDKD